jgi:hypothetical protein
VLLKHHLYEVYLTALATAAGTAAGGTPTAAAVTSDEWVAEKQAQAEADRIIKGFAEAANGKRTPPAAVPAAVANASTAMYLVENRHRTRVFILNGFPAHEAKCTGRSRN